MDNRYMLEPQLSSSRSKRQRSEPPRLNKTSQPIWKKQRLSRLSHPSGSQPTLAFWDNLSEIWLTKQALRELDRRNFQAALRARWPVTRVGGKLQNGSIHCRPSSPLFLPLQAKCFGGHKAICQTRWPRSVGPEERMYCKLLAGGANADVFCSTLNLSIVPIAR